MKKNTLFYGLTLSIALNLGLLSYNIKHLIPSPQGVENKRMERKPTLVKYASAQKKSIAVKKSISGQLRASQSVSLGAQIPGRIKAFFFKPGDIVKKGQLLIQLDDGEAKADVESLQARESVAKQHYMSIKELKDSEGRLIRSAFEVASKKSEWEVAKAELNKSKLRLSQTQIRAPFDGVTGLIPFSEGAYVDPRQELTRIITASPMVVEFDVVESQAAMLKIGQKIDVLIPDVDPLPESAEIVAIQPYSDASSHTVRFHATFENPEGKFRDGAYAKVTVTLASNEGALVVPRDAVQNENNQDFVYTIKSVEGVQKVRKIPVIVGMKEEDKVEIEEGIKEGDIVITDPVDIMMDGLPVRPEISEQN